VVVCFARVELCCESANERLLDVHEEALRNAALLQCACAMQRCVNDHQPASNDGTASRMPLLMPHTYVGG
jgi:hypothetical protein